ncbi:hypothetical protein [Nocardioides pacificus]
MTILRIDHVPGHWAAEALGRELNQLDLWVLGRLAARAGLRLDIEGSWVSASPEALAAMGSVECREAPGEDLMLVLSDALAAEIWSPLGDEWAAEVDAVVDLAVAGTLDLLPLLVACLAAGRAQVDQRPLAELLGAVVCSAQSVWLV